MKQQNRTTRKIYYRKRQRLRTGGFLNTGRDTVNQLGKIATGVIKNASTEINNIAQQCIQQAISQGGKEPERNLPKIFKGAIEDVYQPPFRLLRNFGKKQFQKIKNKILR